MHARAAEAFPLLSSLYELSTPLNGGAFAHNLEYVGRGGWVRSAEPQEVGYHGTHLPHELGTVEAGRWEVEVQGYPQPAWIIQNLRLAL